MSAMNGLFRVRRPLMLAIAAVLAALVTVSSRAEAEPAPVAVIHASPDGAGARNGQRPADAMPIARAFPLVAAGTRAMRLVLAPGTYDIGAMASQRLQGRGGGALVIEGAGEKTVLVGSYEPGSKPRTPLLVMARSDVTLRNFAVRNVSGLIDVPNGGTAERIVVSGIAMTDVHDGIVIDRGKTLVANDWLIDKVRITNHYRVGIRLAGTGTSRIVIRDSLIDGGGESGPNDCFKGGIQMLEGVSDVTIERVQVSNNVGCANQHYQQGDGIEIDDRKTVPKRITLKHVVSSGNRDGNFDLKGQDIVLEDLVSRADGVTRYGFRFWNHSYSCLRCSLDGEGGNIQLMHSIVTLRDPKPTEILPRIRCGDSNSRGPSVYQAETAGQTSPRTICPPPKE
jgi:hypothetical protein